MSNKSQKFLIACDIDGTLLNNHHELDARSITYFQKLQTQYPNVIFCLVTGRNWVETAVIYKQLNLNSVSVCCNGCEIIKPNDANFCPLYFTFEAGIFLQIFQNKTFLSCFHTVWITSRTEVITITNAQEVQDFLKQLKNFDNQLIYTRVKFQFKKFTNDMLVLFKQANFNLQIHCWDYHDREEFYLEMHVPYVSKSFGVEYLSSYYGIPLENTLVFGDNINDLSMLSHKKCQTFALFNGVNLAKTYAKNITDKCNHNLGVVHELKKIFPVE